MKTASRAEYGKHVIEVASAALTEEFGKGFSKTSIKNCKKFFMYFSHSEKGQAVPDQFNRVGEKRSSFPPTRLSNIVG